MPDSIEKCKIELEPTEWEITEVSVLPPLDLKHTNLAQPKIMLIMSQDLNAIFIVF